MKQIPLKIWVPLLIIIAIYVAYHVAYPSSSFRYRMTVEIQTPEGVKTGSAVREVGVDNEPHLFPAAGGTFYSVTKGEAVVVDLGKRGIVFAVMRGADNDVDWGYRVALDTLHGKEKGTEVVLSSDEYPMFARYSGISGSSELEVLYSDEFKPRTDPHKWPIRYVSDRFEEVLGAGVKLNKITIELTDDPVTTGIQKYLVPDDGKLHGLRRHDLVRGETK